MKGFIVLAMMAISLPFSAFAQVPDAPSEKAEAGDVSDYLSENELEDLFSEDDILKLDKFDAAMDAWLDDQMWFLTQAATSQASLKIYVNKTRQTMTVVENGVVKFSGWPVSTGVRGNETRSGVFTPFEMDKNYFSKKFKVILPYGIKFDRGNLIHATKGLSYLGKKRSAGCVRLHPHHAKILFEMVRRTGMKNTRVVIKNAPYQGGASVTASLPDIAL